MSYTNTFFDVNVVSSLYFLDKVQVLRQRRYKIDSYVQVPFICELLRMPHFIILSVQISHSFIWFTELFFDDFAVLLLRRSKRGIKRSLSVLIQLFCADGTRVLKSQYIREVEQPNICVVTQILLHTTPPEKQEWHRLWLLVFSPEGSGGKETKSLLNRYIVAVFKPSNTYHQRT